MYKVQNKQITFQDLGRIDYQKAWDYQESLLKSIVEQKVANRSLDEEAKLSTKNYLLFCEHPPVYTLGKTGKEHHLLLNETQLDEQGFQFYKINRGGDITYHGPGQIVAYPIMDLDNFFTDIHKYLRFIEEAIIKTLADYNIAAGRLEGATGVWLDATQPEKARKICAIGIRASRWVTMHGLAFNVNVDLDHFANIVPCGIDDKAVTSLNKELGIDTVDTELVKARLKKHFVELFEGEIND